MVWEEFSYGNSKKFLVFKYLHLVTEVDHKGVGHGVPVDPLALVLDLKTTHVVLDQKRHQSMICVRRDSDGLVRLWASWIEVCGQYLDASVPIHGIGYVVGFQPQRLRYRLYQLRRYVSRPLSKLRRSLTAKIPAKSVKIVNYQTQNFLVPIKFVKYYKDFNLCVSERQIMLWNYLNPAGLCGE